MTTSADDRRGGAPVVELHEVTKRFGAREALRGLDLRIDPGEVVGFLGPNGAGKTTCLRLLVGLTFRTGGAAAVLGLDPGRDGVRIRRRCCYLPGETSLYHGMTGRQLLTFAKGFYPAHHDELLDRLGDAFRLPLDRRVRQYSAGMKQKLAVMATVAADVDLYLLDEPDRNLDAEARLVLREAVQWLRTRGKTVLFSSHHLGEVEAVATRLVFVLDGRAVDPGRIAAASRRLRDTVRLRLRPGHALPDDVAALDREPDGTYRIRPAVEPLRWVAGLDPAAVESVEVGATRLDDLYRALTNDVAGAEGAP